MSTSDQRLAQCIAELGHRFDGEIVKGGDYAPVLLEGDTAWVSGQVPRVGQSVVITGRVGAATSLEEARTAARICAVRGLVLLQRELGSLDRIARVLRVGVYVQSADTFTQQSEVADAASALLKSVLGPAGVHTRTSVGVHQLPKNASVELEMTVRVRPA
ncbi:MAG TPA: RidA family protein [Ramlibacter sp.]|jgi:enamine deaminase RidA (YjgF/YER057c/UK114 family)|uniref:RidA family protein n=1 Tax=Ramlibacter sp. TaxID=1917967 RepID=UPI002D6C2056|nr:RidA family protein [Ramlibacter sp.]HZY17463.1 RidA family protein [Ramlibacter sp.]